jgi:hypothetical protein
MTPMTENERTRIILQGAEAARRSRAEQGLPPTVQEEATLAWLAALLLPSRLDWEAAG